MAVGLSQVADHLPVRGHIAHRALDGLTFLIEVTIVKHKLRRHAHEPQPYFFASLKLLRTGGEFKTQTVAQLEDLPCARRSEFKRDARHWSICRRRYLQHLGVERWHEQTQNRQQAAGNSELVATVG